MELYRSLRRLITFCDDRLPVSVIPGSFYVGTTVRTRTVTRDSMSQASTTMRESRNAVAEEGGRLSTTMTNGPSHQNGWQRE